MTIGIMLCYFRVYRFCLGIAMGIYSVVSVNSGPIHYNNVDPKIL